MSRVNGQCRFLRKTPGVVNSHSCSIRGYMALAGFVVEGFRTRKVVVAAL
ncbi:MAG: hypothetical protein ACXIT9_14050 [Nitritalea sp.]